MKQLLSMILARFNGNHTNTSAQVQMIKAAEHLRQIAAMDATEALMTLHTQREGLELHIAQLNTQLRFSGFEVGLLLNFRQWPLKDGGIKRVVHTRS